MFPKVTQEVVRFFKIAKKVASFARNFVTKNFQKSPNLVALVSIEMLPTLTYARKHSLML